jgi:hypothetical protein
MHRILTSYRKIVRDHRDLGIQPRTVPLPPRAGQPAMGQDLRRLQQDLFFRLTNHKPKGAPHY